MSSCGLDGEQLEAWLLRPPARLSPRDQRLIKLGLEAEIVMPGATTCNGISARGNMSFARQALSAVTHAAKHKDAVTQQIQWERRDAVAVITMLSALLELEPPL